MALTCCALTWARPQEVVHVAPDGKDTQPGTAKAPLATLQGARDKVRTILAKAGLTEQDVRLFSVTVLEENGYTPLEAEDGDLHWMTFNNFYVITRYNRSPMYAMVVYELSEALRAGMEAS